MSAMERTELKMAVIAEQLGLSWAGKRAGKLQIQSRVANLSVSDKLDQPVKQY